MPIRLRQVAVVAADLAAVEANVEAHLGLSRCFRDPGVGFFGLDNALYPVGHQLLEVVAPIRDGTTAGRLLDKRGGDGGYMVLVQVDDLTAVRSRLERLGVRIVHEAASPGVTGLHVHPRDIGGAIVSIDQTDEWDEWPWAGPEWRPHIRTEVVSAITAVEIQADDPESMAARWAEVLARQADGPVLRLDEGEIRFVPAADGRGEGVAGIEFRAAVDAELDVCGVRCILRAD